MKPLIYPTVKLNGTSREELVKQHLDIQEAFYALMATIRKAMPQSRDYLPSALDHERKDAQARDAFYQRIKLLNDVREDFMRVAVFIQTGNKLADGPHRGRRRRHGRQAEVRMSADRARHAGDEAPVALSKVAPRRRALCHLSRALGR